MFFFKNMILSCGDVIVMLCMVEQQRHPVVACVTHSLCVCMCVCVFYKI